MISLLMCVGKQHYKLHEYINEVSDQGISKAISKTGVIDGLVPGQSKIFVSHPDAIVEVTNEAVTLLELVLCLVGIHHVIAEDYWDDLDKLSLSDLEDEMLIITKALSILSTKNPTEYAKIVDEFGLVFTQGIIGFSYFNGFEYVLPNDKSDLPEKDRDVQDLVDDGTITLVHVEYEND